MSYRLTAFSPTLSVGFAVLHFYLAAIAVLFVLCVALLLVAIGDWRRGRPL